jgi:lipid-binding SYLF domain-containing protein
VGNLAPIFSYSKTKGLFAGVSLEGSVLIERKDANGTLLLFTVYAHYQ